MKQCARLTVLIALFLDVFSAYPQALSLPASAERAPFLVRVPAGVQKLGAGDAPALLKEHLRLGGRDELAPLGLPVTEAGITVQRFQQYHGGVKVEHGVYRLHSRRGVPAVLSGELYRVPGGLALQPALSEDQALLRALSYVGAETYQWEDAAGERGLNKQRGDRRATYYPKGELVISRVYQQDRVRVTDGGLALAYKFDVYAARPLSRAYVYVDAHTGTVIGEDAILKHVDGTGHTRYSGPRTISTTTANGVYRLRDASRGQGVEVYNLQTGTFTGSAVDFTDNDNQWTAAEHDNTRKDNAALDAHWGAGLTYDYFRNVHGRNSMDGNGGKITCYVHYGRDVVNAFWNGSAVLFGDGGTRFDGSQVQPLTTLDITAHEIGHGLCQYTAGLVYRYESGALNEAFSDIWGAMVEDYSGANKAMWTIGEDANFTIRSFSDPNRFGHPDTYLGQYWYTGDGDNGGVHYNSGVLNHWFYLLSVGKTGVNDHGESYAVNGIGAEKAARIAYRTESVYLTANSQYTDACIFSLQAAADLFGPNSAEVVQTVNAWRAVGVYQVASAPSALAAAAASATQVNLTWRDNATGETGYQVERSVSPTGGFAPAGTTGANATAFQDQGVPTDAVYYYRIRAVTGPGAYSAYSNVATVTLGTPPVVMGNGTVAACGAVFLDPGGAGDYPHFQSVITTIRPVTTGNRVRAAFTAFNTEAGADLLRVYDGGSTFAPLIGTYSGNSLPPAVTATNPEGLLTFYFTSNGSVAGAGWRATLSCVALPATPAGLSAVTASATQINLSWSDPATDETGFSIERSLTSGSNFTPIATASANATTYQDKGLATDARYFYRVRAYRGDVFSGYSTEAAAVVGTPPLVMTNGTVTACTGILLDPGGTADYRNNQYVVMTLAPETAGSRVRVAFTAFDTEADADLLRIYDGSSTFAPLIGTYSGNSLPPAVTAANAGGQLTFQFSSGYYNARAGWRATVSCVTPPAAPATLRATAASPTAITLQWTDHAADEAGFAVERSLSPGAGFVQVGTTGPNVTTYADANLATDRWYYYRVRAYKTDVFSLYSNEAGAAVGNAPIRMGNASVTTCNAVFTDAGGNEGYANNENSTLTLSPADATQRLRVTFSAFQTESCCDYLAVYDGATTSAPLIGSYRGSTLPPVINATNAEGKLTFRFWSDGSITGSGWQATVTCVPRPVPTIAALTPASGTAGTLVTITGTHLGEATAVRFSDNVAVPFTRHSDSRITAAVPAGAVSGPIQVVTPGGTATSAVRFTVTKLAASVALGNLTATYDGTPRAVTATTVPAGLDVVLTYDGAAAPPAGAGTYAVTATVRSATHEGSAAGTLVIRKATAGLLAANPVQTYDGTAKTIILTTTPAGLPVEVTYAPGNPPLVNAGSYPFTAKVTDRNYEGSTQGTLVIGKAAQVITLPALPDRTFGESVPELAAAASSGLPVQFALTGPAVRQGNTLSPTGPGKVTVTASQDGDDNHFPAAPVERSFCVLPPKPAISTANSLTEVVLTSSSAEGNQWLRDGQPIAGATGSTYRVTGAGSFSVQVHIAGCENVSDAVTLTANEAPYAAGDGFRVFPNPAPDLVQVRYAAPQSARPPQLIVYNAVGVRVSATALSRQGGEWVATIRLTGYKAGIYLFSLVDPDNRVMGSRRVLKE